MGNSANGPTGEWWVVVDPDGDIIPGINHWREDTCMESFVRIMKQVSEVFGSSVDTWDDLHGFGYRCIKVRIVPVEES